MIVTERRANLTEIGRDGRTPYLEAFRLSGIEYDTPQKGIQNFELSVADGGRRLYLQTMGPINGLPFVVESGTPGSMWGISPTVEELNKKNYLLIKYCRPGYWFSSPKENRLVANAASDVHAITRALGIKRYFAMGSSGGGPHTLATAALFPDEVIGAMALACPTPSTEHMGQHNAWELDPDVEIMKRNVTHIVEKMQSQPDSLEQSLTLDRSADDRRILEDPRNRMLHALGRRRALIMGANGWIDDNVAIFYKDWGVDFGKTKVPVILWQGNSDPIIRGGQEYWLEERIPTAKVVIGRGKSHTATKEMMPFLDMLVEHCS